MTWDVGRKALASLPADCDKSGALNALFQQKKVAGSLQEASKRSAFALKLFITGAEQTS